MSTLSAKSTRTATSQPSVAVKYSAPVHILVQEKINLLADRNGGLEQFEVKIATEVLCDVLYPLNLDQWGPVYDRE